MKREQVLGVAKQVAEEAGVLLRKLRGSPVAVEHKGRIDLVTEADRQAEALIIERLRKYFPTHGILAEESPPYPGGTDCVWYIDPLDGTTNYAHNFPAYCVSIALLEAGNRVLGVVHEPLRGVTYSALLGGGAYCDDVRLRTSPTRVLQDSLLATGFPYDVQESRDDNIDHFGNFIRRSQGVRRCGAAALDLCMLAQGSLDGFWEAKLKPWDVAAGSLIIEEAGGRVSGFRGEQFDVKAGHVIASNGNIHQEMLTVIALGHTMLDNRG